MTGKNVCVCVCVRALVRTYRTSGKGDHRIMIGKRRNKRGEGPRKSRSHYSYLIIIVV